MEIKKAGRQKRDKLIAKTFLSKIKFTKGRAKKIKATKRSRQKANNQYRDFQVHEYLKDILELYFTYIKEGSGTIKDFIENLEEEILIQALILFNGNQKQASKFLGLKPSTMCMKCKKYRIISKLERKSFAENTRHSKNCTPILTEEKPE